MITIEPFVGPLTIAIDAKSRPSSASVSLPARFRVVVEPSLTVKLSATATGASLTGVTVRLTVTVFEVAPLRSSIVYVKLSATVSLPSWV